MKLKLENTFPSDIKIKEIREDLPELKHLL